jgi:hypothetical protein
VSLALCPAGVAAVAPATYREPLCPRWAFPTAGWYHAPPQRALPLLRRSYGLMRPTLVLARPSLGLYRPSLQVAASPCWSRVVPDVISACLFLDAWTLTPAAWRVHLPISFPTTIGLPPVPMRSATRDNPLSDFRAGVISELQSFAHVQASRFAATQVAPTVVSKHEAAVAFTSEQNTGRCLPVHRIY